MGLSKQQALANREAIVSASERLFRHRGVDAVGLTELMRAAGFTQGGFYNHFPTKEALATEVVTLAMRKTRDELATVLASLSGTSRDRLRQRVGQYLSGTHSDDLGEGCAIAGLAGDVRRLGPEAQRSFAEGLNAVFDIFGEIVEEPDARGEASPSRRGRAIGVYCEMIGALVLARAVGGAAPELAREILVAGRAAILGGEEKKGDERP